MTNYEHFKCGNCKHFIRNGNKAIGKCEKRKYLNDKWGEETDRLFIPSQRRKACKNDFEPITPKKMTNYERIKNMSVEEMAQTLFNHQFGHCSECALKNKECSGNYFDDLSCIFGIKKWLLSASADNLCTEDSL